MDTQPTDISWNAIFSSLFVNQELGQRASFCIMTHEDRDLAACLTLTRWCGYPQVSDFGTEIAPIMDNWSTRLFGSPTGETIEDARSTADQSNNHSSLWSYLLHYREASRNQAGH